MRTVLVLVGNEFRRFAADKAAISLTFIYGFPRQWYWKILRRPGGRSLMVADTLGARMNVTAN
jgi:hypothetical protein